MSWQLVMTLQIIVSSLVTIFTRWLALSDRKLFFTIGVASYSAIAAAGYLYAFGFDQVGPQWPGSEAWLYILLEGFCIPAAWLLQYKIISRLGAVNVVIIIGLNNVGAALMGILFLGETFSLWFLLGTFLVINSVLVAFWVQPDVKHHDTTSLPIKVLMALSMFILFSLGMFFEKKAIDVVGVWDYARFGWSMQFVGASILFLIYGRKELKHASVVTVSKGLLLGFITSVAGGLFIYALSVGALSHTVIAATGKIAITMVLAAIILRERNAIVLRLTAFALSVTGLYFILL